MTRLNARIDDHLARKIEFLKKRSSATTTEVVKAAIDLYFAQAQGEESAASRLEGFIGVASGANDLSTDYKRYLSAGISKKL